MKKILLIVLTIICYNLSYAQIQLNSTGDVGICGAPYGSNGLTIGNNGGGGIPYANTFFFSNTIEFYTGYSHLIIDGSGYYGNSIHPASNNYCNVGNSNLAFYTMWSYAYNKPSDLRQKENIRDIKNALDIVLQLKGVEYDLKKEYAYNDSLIKNEKMKAKCEAERKNQLGFLAQDVNKILPEAVVYDDSTDIYGIDYTKVVPVLVEAIKELNAKIDSLKKIINNNSSSLKSAEVTTGTNKVSNPTDKPYLEQNVPNPFNQSTQVNFYLPENITSSTLYIYDMNGTQIKSIPILQRGNSTVIINGSELKPGMYLYTLIADGIKIDTKHMILTE
jgi:hypothetical protein